MFAKGQKGFPTDRKGVKRVTIINLFFKQKVLKKFEKLKTVNFVEREPKESTNGMKGLKRNQKFRKR